MTKLTNEELLDAYDRALDQVSAYQAGPEDKKRWLDYRAEILKRMAEGAAGEASRNLYQLLSTRKAVPGLPHCRQAKATWAATVA